MLAARVGSAGTPGQDSYLPISVAKLERVHRVGCDEHIRKRSSVARHLRGLLAGARELPLVIRRQQRTHAGAHFLRIDPQLVEAFLQLWRQRQQIGVHLLLDLCDRR